MQAYIVTRCLSVHRRSTQRNYVRKLLAVTSGTVGAYLLDMRLVTSYQIDSPKFLEKKDFRF